MSNLKITRRYQFANQFVDLPAASNNPEARWEQFQLAQLCDNSIYNINDKSRQVAASFTMALEAVINAILEGQSSAFVSINLEEASEKIRYAQHILTCIHTPFKLPKLKRENRLTMEWENGARLISLPNREPRGKPQFHVYLDEFAHLLNARGIYSAAQGLIAKGRGQLRLRIASSLMGESGMHWEISTQTLREYGGFVRYKTPWWVTWAFCKNPIKANIQAPKMSTEERVAMFGRDTIQQIFSNVYLEDFQREFEAIYSDTNVAFITWDEIKNAYDGRLVWVKAHCEGKNISPAHQAIDQILLFIRANKIEKVLAAGMDIGRKRDTSEIFVVGKSTTGQYPLRLAITMNMTPYDEQLDVIHYLMTQLPISKLFIDQTGLGNNLAESAKKLFPNKVEGVDFTASSKELWAGDAKMLIQQGKTPLPVDRDIATQINSIKQRFTGSRMSYDTEKNEKHHADKFWAWALSLAAARVAVKRPWALQG